MLSITSLEGYYLQPPTFEVTVHLWVSGLDYDVDTIREGFAAAESLAKMSDKFVSFVRTFLQKDTFHDRWLDFSSIFSQPDNFEEDKA